MAKATIKFEPSGKAVEVDTAEAPFSGTGLPGSILDIACGRGIEIAANCGGGGVCGVCYVVVESGAENISAPEDDERATLDTMVDDCQGARLACQAVVSGDVTVRVP